MPEDDDVRVQGVGAWMERKEGKAGRASSSCKVFMAGTGKPDKLSLM